MVCCTCGALQDLESSLLRGIQRAEDPRDRHGHNRVSGI